MALDRDDLGEHDDSSTPDREQALAALAELQRVAKAGLAANGVTWSVVDELIADRRRAAAYEHE